MILMYYFIEKRGIMLEIKSFLNAEFINEELGIINDVSLHWEGNLLLSQVQI